MKKGIEPGSFKTFKPVQTSEFASSEALDTVKEKEIQPITKE